MHSLYHLTRMAIKARYIIPEPVNQFAVFSKAIILLHIFHYFPLSLSFLALPAKELHQSCVYDQQCKGNNPNSYCFKIHSGDLRCWCRPGYHSEIVQENPPKYNCVSGEYQTTKEITYPSMLLLS